MPAHEARVSTRLHSLLFEVLRARSPELCTLFDGNPTMSILALAARDRSRVQHVLGDELFQTGFSLPGNQPTARDLQLEELIDLFGPRR